MSCCSSAETFIGPSVKRWFWKQHLYFKFFLVQTEEEKMDVSSWNVSDKQTEKYQWNSERKTGSFARLGKVDRKAVISFLWNLVFQDCLWLIDEEAILFPSSFCLFFISVCHSECLAWALAQYCQEVELQISVRWTFQVATLLQMFHLVMMFERRLS